MPSHADRIRAANQALLVEGDLDAVALHFAPDYRAHVGGRTRNQGHAGVRSFVRRLRRAFADLEVQVEVLHQGRGRVTWQRTVRGRHRGTQQGFEPSGRRVTWHDLLVSRFEGGLIVEEWAVSDLAEQLLRGRRR